MTPDQLTPRRLPTTEQERLRDRLRRIGRGREIIGESERYVWKRESYPVNENYIDVKASGRLEVIIEQAISRFRVAQSEGYVWFHFYAQLIRYIPENPQYTGELARKAGKFAPDTWPVGSTNVYQGTETQPPPGGVAGAIYHAFEFRGHDYRGNPVGQPGYTGSVDDVSQSRTIWWLFYTLEFFTRKPDSRAPLVDIDEPLLPIGGDDIFRGRRRRRR